MDQSLARQAAIQALEARGYRATDVSHGQGVPRLSRLMLEHGGWLGTKSCVVKFSTGGRISFARDDSGRFSVLPDMDFVLHVRPVFDGSEAVRVSLFDKVIVAKAFEENLASLERRSMGHIPSWVNPDFENGWRLAGSGFQNRALWSDIVPLHAQAEARNIAAFAEPAASHVAGPTVGISISEAKQRLSVTFGVPAEAIEITIRG